MGQGPNPELRERPLSTSPIGTNRAGRVRPRHDVGWRPMMGLALIVIFMLMVAGADRTKVRLPLPCPKLQYLVGTRARPSTSYSSDTTRATIKRTMSVRPSCRFLRNLFVLFS